ncbi:MAG: leucine-rich repeat domain-containing protein [Bacteroidia bacterium]|nr:leucine-rich repeat domain-containing protein [Bacteroidia bacterium]
MKTWLRNFCFVFFVIGTICVDAQKKSSKYELLCHPKEINKFCNLSERSFHYDSLVLKGADEETEWRELFTKISSFPNLKYIELNGNDLDELPEGFKGLTQIRALAIKNNPLLDLKKSCTVLKDFPLLNSLSLEISGINELPGNINTLLHIEQLNLIEAVLDDEQFAAADKIQKLEFRQPLAFADKSRREISITYTGTDADLMRDDVSFLPSLYPGTYDNALVAETGFVPQLLTKEMLAEKNVFVKKYDNVVPPIKDLDIEKNFYEINAVQGGTIKSESGTVIKLPANAFVDGAGNLITEKVIVNYREFKDPIDFLVSGIPMTYDSGGTSNTFQSAGMFELNASADGKEVFLAPGKKVEMDFVSTDPANTYNFYSFNDKKNNWENIGKPGDAKVQAAASFTIYSNAWRFYKSLSQVGIPVYDTVTFNERFLSNDYYFTREKTKDNVIDKKKKKKIRANRLVKIASVNRNRAGEIKFFIKHNEVTHPEMNCFIKNKWMLIDNMQASDFRSAFSSGKYYSDIRILDNGNSYEIQLKCDAGIKSFNAVPMEFTETKVEGKHRKGWTELKDGGKKLFKKYNRRLKLRNKTFDGKLSRTYRIKRSRYNNAKKSQEAYAWKEAKKIMSPEEHAMPKDQWMVYAKYVADHEKELLGKMQATTETISRSLSLEGFGIYNCDQISRMEQPIVIKPEYKGENKPGAKAETKDLRVSTTYVICKGRNAVFNYGDYGGDLSTKKFPIERTKEVVIISIENNGTLAFLSAENVKKSGIQAGGKQTLTMQEFESKDITIEQLKKLAGF